MLSTVTVLWTMYIISSSKKRCEVKEDLVATINVSCPWGKKKPKPDQAPFETFMFVCERFHKWRLLYGTLQILLIR